MKRALMLHGTDGSPTELAWQGWLQQQLVADGWQVFFPQLPDCHRPNLATYDAFLQRAGWDVTDGLVIGHSSGATTTLHLLGQDWFPHVRAAVLVGTFLREDLVKTAPWYEPGQFDQLFVDEFDTAQLRTAADAFYFVHGDNDPYCDYAEARQLCAQLDGTFITLSGAGHIASSANIAEMPELVGELVNDGIMRGTKKA